MKKIIGVILILIGGFLLLRGSFEKPAISEEKDINKEPERSVGRIILAPNYPSETKDVGAVSGTTEADKKESSNLVLKKLEEGASIFEPKIQSVSSVGRSAVLDSYSELLLDRALREAQNEAKKAAKNLMHEMLAPVQANERSFADKLYNIMSAAKGLAGNNEKYRAYVAKRFSEEILADGVLQENLDAISQEYLYALQRISNQVVIDSGRDIFSLPEMDMSNVDFEKIIRADATNSMGTIATAMVHEARVGTTVRGVAIYAGFAAEKVIRYPVLNLVVGLAVEEAVAQTANTFRDPTGNIAIGAISSAEKLTESVCFGTEEHMGFYQYLLRISQFHNDQLRALLQSAEGISPSRENADNFIF